MTSIPEHRRGKPSPLIFHLSTALGGYQQAMMAALNAPAPDFPWHADLESYEGGAPWPFDVGVEAAGRLREMAGGIAMWQRHPYRRAATERPVLWSQGSTRLIDYRPQGGAPVVVVPSLINRPYILDLMPGRSFLVALAEAGLRPLLLDWGAPGKAEAGLGLEDYRYRRLAPALAIASVLGQGPPALVGYCMGGTLAALHVQEGAEVSRLVTIGAPWAFGAGRGQAAEMRGLARSIGVVRVRQMIRGLTQAFGLVPDEVFQQLFALVDPIQAARKFRRFRAMDQGSEAARHFVALEDWLADGVAMAGPAAEDLLVGWQLEDRLAGCTGAVSCPALVITGTGDSIAPPPVAAPLAAAIAASCHLSPALGHVGMIAGNAAAREVWTPVVEFLRDSG